ncbi:hypothetical protein HPB51_006210 [Rhipicephalus microplus]|uniref:DUF4817 domain-containing protein n=1 Tax=Rhipicephalus microplus TaxID=6941 RepID=A0A9J6DKZ2_RHIMP|nr:hypothetical protein HPB51_006210 [Rhipicephalus microplus]
MNGNASLAMELYASRHPHRPLPTRPTFTNLFRRFCTTGSVHLPRRTRKAIVDEDFEIDVVACVTSMPELSIRQIADQCGRSIGTERRHHGNRENGKGRSEVLTRVSRTRSTARLRERRTTDIAAERARFDQWRGPPASFGRPRG